MADGPGVRPTVILPVIALLSTALLPTALLPTPATAQTAVPESATFVSNATTYRLALAILSADPSGPHSVTLTADIVLDTDNEPHYDGTQALTIDGNGFSLDGGGLNRAILHDSAADLTIRDLTVRNAASPPGQDGGAVATGTADVTIEASTFEDNATPGNGGAIEVQSGSLTITDSTFARNQAGNVGGAGAAFGGPIVVEGSTFTDNGSVGDGGALRAGAGATITGGTFTGNTASGKPTGAEGGALDFGGTGAISVTGSQFSGNEADGRGGAINVSTPSASLEVDTTWFSDNHVLDAVLTGGGGAVATQAATTITDSTFEANTVTDGDGGAVHINSNQPSRIESTMVGDNQVLKVDSNSRRGGAIRSTGTGTLTLAGVSLSGNSVAGTTTRGGGISGTDLVIEDSSVLDNHADGGGGRGGGVEGGTVIIRRSDLRSNTANGGGAQGGAVHGTTVTIEASTLTANHADGGGGTGGAAQAGLLTVRNTLLDGNSAGFRGGAVAVAGSNDVVLEHVTAIDNGADQGGHVGVLDSGEATISASAFGPTAEGTACANMTGTITSLGGNIVVDDPSCGFAAPGDRQDVTDLLLGPRRDNGGPEQTRFPLAGSPVVDTVPAADCPLATDHRGVARPYGSACDSGYLEQVYPAHGFTDVPPWVEDTVRWITSTVNDPALMTGISPTRFRPNDPITRAQVVRMLHRLVGVPSVSDDHPFTDVPGWVDEAVQWAYAEGIATGITPTTFVPNDPITRGQVVRMVYRVAGSADPSGLPPHPFTDVPGWVTDAVAWAADSGYPLPLVTGITPTTFRPNDDITRAQVARMVYRLAITPDAWAGPVPYTVPANAVPA